MVALFVLKDILLVCNVPNYLHRNTAQLEYLSDFRFPSQTPTEASGKSIIGREKCFPNLSGEEGDTN